MELYFYFDDLKLKMNTIKLWSLHAYGKTFEDRHDDGDVLRITSSRLRFPEIGSRLVGL